MKKRVMYAVANYEELVRENGYFIDKTAYLEKLEEVKNPVFLRPRRFGKSLLCRILECYYNINQKDDFERLFGHTYIGQHPTPLRNAFFVLHLDFSTVDPTGTLDKIAHSFDLTSNFKIRGVVARNRHWFGEQMQIDLKESAAANLAAVSNVILDQGLPPL
jgi:hypothetical protein